MKLKLTIALVILALVLGFVLTACDDGEVVTITDTQKTVTVGGSEYKPRTEVILDQYGVPYIDGTIKSGETDYGKIKYKGENIEDLEPEDLDTTSNTIGTIWSKINSISHFTPGADISDYSR